MCSADVHATEGLDHLYVGSVPPPLLESIAEETITEELEDEEETLVKRVDSDSESEISADWVIISPQSYKEEFTEIEKDCSTAEADPTPFSDEVKSSDVGSQVFSARLTKTKKPREEHMESQEVTEDKRESGDVLDITNISQLREAQASDPELSLIRAWLKQPETVPN